MQPPSDAPDVRPGLRERKKAQTRAVLAETAKAMFEARGFDTVTVAEIADAANVSVKTLFKYFDSKEDLLFSDENELRDRILAGVRDRKPGESALDGIRRLFTGLISSAGHRKEIEAIEGLRRTFAGNVALQGRLTLMWERYEIALAELLRQDTGAGPHDPTPRLAAAQIIALFRLLTSEEVHAHLKSHPPEARGRALDLWIETSFGLVGGGVRRYAVRRSA